MDQTTKTGIGIGNILAFILSYRKWHSLLWALFHGMLGWWYVIYYAFTHA